MNPKACRAAIRSGFLIFSLGSVGYATAYDPLDCLNDIANIVSEIIIGLATKLCSGAWSSEPVKCYEGVSKIDWGIPRAICT